MEFSPLQFLLSRLEEEIEFQQKLATTYLVNTPKYSPETYTSIVETIKRVSNNLRLISLIMGELEEEHERTLKEEALILSSESLSLTSVLLPAIERVSPIFLENVRLENKPFLEKIEEVLSEIENALEKLELSSSRRIARTLEDLAKTLEFSVKLGEKCIEKES